MRKVFITALLGGMMIPALGFCDDAITTNTTVTQPVAAFYKQAPAELTIKLTEKLAGFKKKYAVTAEATNNVRTSIESKDIKQLNPDEIQQTGKAIIPAAADMMVFQDEKVRKNAVVALGISIPKYQENPKDTEEDDSLRGLLLRRSLLDKSKEVRMLAIHYMKRLAFARLENIPEDVMTGLKEALSDPDQELREMADKYIKWIDEALKELQQKVSNS